MRGLQPPAAWTEVASAFFSSAKLASALATAAIGTVVCSSAIRSVMGWAGLIAIIVVLLVLASLSLITRREAIEWHGLLPISLLFFVGWASISVIWSSYQWATLGGAAYLVALTALGIYVALVRDTIQIVRCVGDVMRFALIASLVIEVVAGVLIDGPIRFMGVQGNLDQFGPIQGILFSRNHLGLVAIVAAITFVIELRTKSVPRGLAVGSVVVAGIAIALTRSPIVYGASLLVAVAVIVLYGVRRVPPATRDLWQFGVLAAAVMLAITAWVLRSQIVAALNAGGELTYRLRLWQEVWSLVPLHLLEGWGWVGRWRRELEPFIGFDAVGARADTSALNAYLDAWFQLGLLGFIALVGMAGLAFVRSWLLAGRRRSVVFTWPALVLVALLTVSLAESTMFTEFGWVAFVICCVKAARELSWRKAFASGAGGG